MDRERPLGGLVSEQVRDVLRSMGGIVGFTSTTLAYLDADKGGLVLNFAMGSRLPWFQRATDAIGFDPTGAAFPLWAVDTIIIRCYREGRLLSTTNVHELVRGLLAEDVLKPIEAAIGLRLYVCVPVFSASGTTLAVILLDRAEIDPLTSDERDQLLLYADRIGQLLEADRFGAAVLARCDESPVTRWLSVHLLEKDLSPLWSGGAGPDASQVVAALEGRVLPGTVEVSLEEGIAVLVHIHAVDPTGEVAWLLLCEDLASRDRESRDLREQLRLRLSLVQEAVLSVDTELRVTSCNDAARAVFGYEPAEMIGEPIVNYLPDREISEGHSRLTTDLADLGHVERQLTLQRRDGSTFPAEISILLLSNEEEEASGAIATVRDLTEQRRLTAERHRLERKLIRSERLAALGEMAARIAHEVRNPLAAIGATALAIEEEPDEGQEAQGRARAIGAEVRRLDAILNDLLSFAKPRSAPRTMTDIGQVIREAVSVARVDPNAREVEFRVDVGKASGLAAPVDPDGIRQVMMNLLRNAVEASGAGGRVGCSVERSATAVIVEISNSGAAVSSPVQRRAFEPFFSTKSRGTGLGLPISRRIIEEHGGSLQLRALDDGSVTRFDLPLTSKDQE